MNTMDFNTLVKMIHPDLNPNIDNPGEKMSEATKNRHNPNMLFFLAEKWGLTGNSSREKTQFHDVNEGFVIGNMFLFDGKFYGVVVGITDGQGRRRGHKKVFCVRYDTHKLVHFFVPNVNHRFRNITFQGRADKDFMRTANQVYLNYIGRKEEYDRERRQYQQRREQYTREDLRSNSRYWEFNVWIYTRTKGGPYRVVRTTAKMVYYWDEREGKERGVRMSSVTRVWSE